MSVTASTQFVYLSWQPLMEVVNITFQYEVAYSTVSNCSSASLPNNPALYTPRATSNSTEVFGLVSGTCYVFGVRGYSSKSSSPGQFSTISGVTVSEGILPSLILYRTDQIFLYRNI